ncbi:ParB/RepB/Spo0J family partition protein [Nitratireductor sp. XY-223]|uniref:ParB/RepB/Spo0J family partition protein n=1 Tax=Nitratireductor sp. XY-223 TaxID=2561926 RepID=UPI001FF04E11|nr:ParB/RepB/Spo0J family partition protein [Nitratireductor sp. XY-223]
MFQSSSELLQAVGGNLSARVANEGRAIAGRDANRHYNDTGREGMAKFLRRGVRAGSFGPPEEAGGRGGGSQSRPGGNRGAGLIEVKGQAFSMNGSGRGKKAFSARSGETDMANPKKIALSQSRDIPFNKLVLSDRNVRRVQAGVSIDDLAEDIARRTLLQSLSVRPVIGEDGQFTDRYEVQAGGRRYRALELLVRQKRLNRTAPIPCVIREDGILEEDSLAENCQRQALHPLDAFRAFQSLKDQGLGEEDIAARFFVTPKIVKQRLKLASVSPKLLDIYAADEMTLEQLMSFTISDDHARQSQVWETVQRGYNQEPYYIRKLMTEETVRASDKRARFVGLPAYEEAGGVILRDLFSQNDEGWLQDVALLERLVAAKLTTEAETIRAEGWRWIQMAQDFPYGHTAGLRRVMGETEPLSDDEHARREALRDEMAEIEERYFQEGDEDLPEEVDKRLAGIEAELDGFENRPVIYDTQEIARAGVFVSIDGDGKLNIERGYVRSEDEAQSAAGADAQDAEDFVHDHVEIVHVGRNGETRQVDPIAALSGDGGQPADEEPADEELKPLSERLVMELTAHRTLALRDALAGDPDIAFLAALHALVLQTFWRYPAQSCLELRAESRSPTVQGPGLKESASATAIEERHANWQKQLPDEPELLWAFLCEFDHDSRMALFAHCVSLTVYAVHESWSRAPGGKRHADQLACALCLDMNAAGWTPTAENYLNRVPRARILEAVTEARGENMAELIEGLKKSDMAEQAERLLADSGWLPEPLRTPGIETALQVDEGEATESGVQREDEPADDLPEFLTAAE